MLGGQPKGIKLGNITILSREAKPFYPCSSIKPPNVFAVPCSAEAPRSRHYSVANNIYPALERSDLLKRHSFRK